MLTVIKLALVTLFSKYGDLQECIPVGCILSAVVTILGGRCLPEGCVCLGVCVWLGGVCLGGVYVGGVHSLMNRMTDACENITFPQLLWRTVIIIMYFTTVHCIIIHQNPDVEIEYFLVKYSILALEVMAQSPQFYLNTTSVKDNVISLHIRSM